MVMGEYQWGFPLQIFDLYTNLSFPSQLRLVCKMSYKCLLSAIWPKHLIACLPFFWVPRVPPVLLKLSGLRRPSCCSTLSASLLYTLFLLNYEPILSVWLLLLLCHSIKFSLLPIPPSSPCLFCSFLHQNNPKSFSLCHQVIKLQNLLGRESWCLLPAHWKILLRLLYNPYFLSPFFSQFGASCSEMTRFPTIVTSPHFSVPVYVHCIGVLPWNIQNRFLLLFFLSQTSFSHISTNSLTIPTVSRRA